MAGLDPAIHHLPKESLRKAMDARAFAPPKRLRPRRRVKPAHGGYADLRMALSTRVLPSDQIAPGTLWLSAITVSNARSIQLQSSSVMVNGGSRLMVWLPWPETWVRILWSLNSGTVMSWQNRPLLAVSSTFHDAFRRSDFGGPNSTPIISPLPRTSFINS